MTRGAARRVGEAIDALRELAAGLDPFEPFVVVLDDPAGTPDRIDGRTFGRTVLGTVLGVLLIGVINNGLDLLSVSSYYQAVIKGVIIVGAVWLDRRQARS